MDRLPRWSLFAVTAACLTAACLGALATVDRIERSGGGTPFAEDPWDPGSYGLALLFCAIFVVEGTALALAKRRWDARPLLSERLGPLVRWGFLGILSAPAALAVGVWLDGAVPGHGLPLGVLAVAPLFALNALRPYWIAIDLLGVLAASGILAILGPAFEPGPMFLVLAAILVYDAVAVYMTGHMIGLVDAAVRLRIPLFLLAARDPLLKLTDIDGAPALIRMAKVDKRAIFLGLGDVVIPSLMSVSAFAYVSTDPFWRWAAALLVLAGSLAGFAWAQVVSIKRPRAHAGLPFMNTGAMAGVALAMTLVGLLGS